MPDDARMRASMLAVRPPKVELTLLQRAGWQMAPPPKMQQPPHWGRGVPGSQPEPHGMRSDLSVTVYSEALSQRLRLSRRRRKCCLVPPNSQTLGLGIPKNMCGIGKNFPVSVAQYVRTKSPGFGVRKIYNVKHQRYFTVKSQTLLRRASPNLMTWSICSS